MAEMGMSNFKMYYQDSDGEYKPIGHIDETELTMSCDSDSENLCHRFMDKEMTITAKLRNPEGIFIALTTGNDLYLRFPKKLRRRRRRC